MSDGQESIGFETLKSLLEKAQQKPLKPEETEVIDGVEWRVLRLTIPGSREHPYLPGVITSLLASVSYRPKGLVEAKDVVRFRDGGKGAIIAWSKVLAAEDGFTEEAMKVFRRSKRMDYVSETHWPNDWPKAKTAAGDSKSK